MRHTFPSGEWVDVMPIQDMKTKHRDLFSEAAAFGLPMSDDGEVDKAAIASTPGGAAVFWSRNAKRRRAIAVAIVVREWSYPAPVPTLTEDAELLSGGSVGETDAELMDVMGPYFEKLTREPDPKGSTTYSQNGRSEAEAAAPTG